jgi:diguanylate cyclase (GGDEF)-like protein/PAS domain S-box-containing protein
LSVVLFLYNIWNKRIIYEEGRGMMSTQFFIGLMAGICISLLFTLYLYRRWNNQKKEFIENQERLVKVVENTKDILYYYQVKPERQFKYLSPSLKVFFGEDAVQRNYNDPDRVYKSIHPDYYDILHKKIIGEIDYNQPIVQRWRDPDGNYRWFEEYTTPIYENGELVAIQGVLRNIDEKIKLQQDLEYRIHHDSLTHIYNREFFQKQMDKFDNQVDTSVGIILCDLDELKYMNDNFGHKEGDTLIKEAAKVLNKFSSEKTIVARIGGDEFAILVTDTNKEEVEKLLVDISREIYKYNEQSTNIKIKMSAGIAFSNTSIGNMNELFAQADKNMYREKKAKKESPQHGLTY